MAEMARSPVNLDNLMNEGIAFAIDRFQVNIPDCPIGQRPVMIGRRKPAYNTMDKVMGRLDRCHECPGNDETHCCCEFMKPVTCISVSLFLLIVMNVEIKRSTWDRPPRLFLGCLQSLFCLVTWEGLSVFRACLHRVDIVVGWNSTNTTVPYPNQTHRGVSIRVEPWPHSNPYRPTHACVVR